MTNEQNHMRTAWQLMALAAKARLLADDLENYDPGKSYSARLQEVKRQAEELSDAV